MPRKAWRRGSRGAGLSSRGVSVMIQPFARGCEADAGEGLADVSGSTAPTDLSPSPSCRRHAFCVTWGGVRGGGKPSVSWFDLTHYLSAIPPTLSLPHVVSKTRLRRDGGGDDGVAALELPRSWRSRAPHETLGPGSRAGIGAVGSRRRLGPRLPGMTRGGSVASPYPMLSSRPSERSDREPGPRGPDAKAFRKLRAEFRSGRESCLCPSA